MLKFVIQSYEQQKGIMFRGYPPPHVEPIRQPFKKHDFQHLELSNDEDIFRLKIVKIRLQSLKTLASTIRAIMIG